MIKKIVLLLLSLCSLPGFAQLTIENDTTYGSLFDDPIELNEVIVSSRKKNMQSKGLGNIQINTQLLKVSPSFLGEKDIIKTLQFLPGVSAGMEGSSQLNIRGGTGDQTLYLLDDVPVYNQNHTFGLFSIFNSDAINNVDLYKGGIPAQYGDKLSGVVSVSLKDGDYKKHNTSLSVGLLAGTIASDGYIIKDKLSYNVAGRRSLPDLLYKGIMGLSGEDNYSSTLFSFYDINAKLSWKLNAKNNLSWQLYNGYDDLFGSNRMAKESSGEKFSEKVGYGWKTYMTALRYYSQLKPNLLFSGNIYYIDLDNFNYYKSHLKTPGEKQKTENGKSSLLKETGGKITFEHKTSGNNTLFYGLEGAYQKYTPDYVFKKNNSQTINYHMDYIELAKFSGYANNEFHYKQWFFHAGIRFSLYDNMKNKLFVVEPRLKANYYLGEKNKFMFAFDRMYQPVNTVNEMNYNVQTDFWLPYQEKKLPASSQVSIGWKNYTTSELSLSVEAYYKKMTNLLLIKDLENYLDDHTAFETGKGTAFGAEFMAEYTKGNFTAWVSYTLSKSRRTFGVNTFPFKYDAPHSLSVFGNYNFNKSDKKVHSVSMNVQYKTGYPYYIPTTSYPTVGLPSSPSGYEEIKDIFSAEYIPDKPNTRLRNYFRIDLNYTLEKKCKRGTSAWQFSLLNATNRSNPYSVYKKDGKYKAFVLIPLLPSISFKRTF
jgi:hypothetical protein